MSVFYCHHCDNCVDSDYTICHEDPSNPLELVCEGCAERLGIDGGEDEDS
jgi:hypothetical protein